jgi:hypothetical protein
MKRTGRRFGSAFLAAGFAASLCVAANAAEKKESGPTQAQIDCQNRAVNDYWDQVKACDTALSDIPDQNALCKSDAAADLNRNKTACTAQAAIGGQLKDPGLPTLAPTVSPGTGGSLRNPQVKTPMLKLEVAPQ